MEKKAIMIAAGHSGSGKTIASCALMAAMKERGLTVAAAKCGPDYIDPMFHREVVGVASENLDLFFQEEAALRGRFEQRCKEADLTVVEGVMGYYDGMSLSSWKGSSYDVAPVSYTHLDVNKRQNTVWRNFQQIGKMRSEKAGVRRYTCLSGRQGLRSERLLLL